MAEDSFREDHLAAALAECFVPALRRDVVAAGLVRSAKLQLDGDAPGTGIAGVPPRYLALIELTAPGGEETINAQVRAAIENRLLGLPQISRVVLTLRPALFSILTGR